MRKINRCNSRRSPIHNVYCGLIDELENKGPYELLSSFSLLLNTKAFCSLKTHLIKANSRHNQKENNSCESSNEELLEIP